MCTRVRAYHFWMQKNRRNDKPVFSPPDDIRRGTDLSAARFYGHTPRKLPPFKSNLPHHRRLRPLRRPVIIQQHPRVCQGLFKKISLSFSENLPFTAWPVQFRDFQENLAPKVLEGRMIWRADNFLGRGRISPTSSGSCPRSARIGRPPGRLFPQERTAEAVLRGSQLNL